MTDKQLWTTKELAKFLGLGLRTVRAKARRGEIPTYRPNEWYMRFDPDEIQEWLKTRTEIKLRDTTGKAGLTMVEPLAETGSTGENQCPNNF